MDEIREEIYNIINDYNEDGDVQECVEEIQNFLEKRNDINEYSVWYEENVFESSGLDVHYIAVAYTDMNNEIHMCGSSMTNI